MSAACFGTDVVEVGCSSRSASCEVFCSSFCDQTKASSGRYKDETARGDNFLADDHPVSMYVSQLPYRSTVDRRGVLVRFIEVCDNMHCESDIVSSYVTLRVMI